MKTFPNKFIFFGREELELSNNSIGHYFDRSDEFDIIIDCAAYTAVDKAKEDQELVNQVSHLAVKQIGEIANKLEAKLIYIH